jgi:hypothetical protein
MGTPNMSMNEEDTYDGNDNTTTCESQRLGKLFGSVEALRDVLAGTFRSMHVLLCNFGFLKF